MEPRILVADSESWAADLLRQVAAELGAEATTVANGIEAIERFKRDAPELVVVDSMLAKVNGLETLARIRATAAGRVVPVILTSAVDQRSEARKLQRRHGFSELLEKPFDAAQARAALGRWLADRAPAAAVAAEPLAELLPGVAAEEAELEGRHLGALLLEHARARRTGVLTLVQADHQRALVLDRGSVIHARSNVPADRLDRVLAYTGRITFEQHLQLEQALAAHRGAIDLAPTLVRLGWLWTEELRGAELAHMTHITLQAALATRGRIRFQPGGPPEGLARQDVRGAELAFWALRRFDGFGSFRERLPSPRSVLARAEGAEHARSLLALTSIEEQVLGLADGRRRVGDLLSIGRFGPIDVARVLHALLALGVLVAHPEGASVAPVAAGSRPPFEPEGELAPGRMIELVAQLWLEHESGRLRLENGADWRELVLDDGEAVWAGSSHADHWLGAILRETGEVTEEDLAEALRIQTGLSGRRIGGILLENRALTMAELDRARQTQIQRILIDALSWRAGSYRLRRERVATSDRATLTMSLPDLLIDAAKRNPAPAAIANLLADPDAVVMKAWDSDQIEHHLHLGRNERTLLDALETGRPAGELAGLELVPREELLRLLHALLALEVVRAARGRASEAEASSGALFHPADLIGDLLDDGVLPEPEGDRISGVIHLGAERAPGSGSSVEKRLRALADENDRLRRRVAELEAKLGAPRRD